MTRSEALADAGRFAEARAAAEKAVNEEPKLGEAYWGRAMVAVKEKNHADSLTWLKRFVEVSGSTLHPEELEKDDLYSEFVRQPQFRELKRWLAERKR